MPVPMIVTAAGAAVVLSVIYSERPWAKPLGVLGVIVVVAAGLLGYGPGSNV